MPVIITAFKCSNCDYRLVSDKVERCPNCGRKFDYFEELGDDCHKKAKRVKNNGCHN